ncbi:MAG: DUF3786 domain-containing protein [Chloroflexi bacterium]|jgi:hypothetical protein|nr:DUF3786 domain-containing protein [Chloroflexota bacterium]
MTHSQEPQQQQSGLDRALALAREQLAQRNPAEIARCAGTGYYPVSDQAGRFVLRFLGQPIEVTFPDGQVTAPDAPRPPKGAVALLLLHYLLHADGCPMGGRWVAFRELDGGLLYDQAFRGRLEPVLLREFARRLDRFEQAARALGGSPLDFGDSAFAFEVLPRLHMAIIFYQGDDEFPPAVSALFDSAASHYLPTEDLAILGGMLTGRLLAAAA